MFKANKPVYQEKMIGGAEEAAFRRNSAKFIKNEKKSWPLIHNCVGWIRSFCWCF